MTNELEVISIVNDILNNQLTTITIIVSLVSVLLVFGGVFTIKNLTRKLDDLEQIKKDIDILNNKTQKNMQLLDERLISIESIQIINKISDETTKKEIYKDSDGAEKEVEYVVPAVYKTIGTLGNMEGMRLEYGKLKISFYDTKKPK